VTAVITATRRGIVVVVEAEVVAGTVVAAMATAAEAVARPSSRACSTNCVAKKGMPLLDASNGSMPHSLDLHRRVHLLLPVRTVSTRTGTWTPALPIISLGS
jgi:hypothetical protein